MPWILGIDEAGYGPNLGPFVMSSVACRVPEQLRDADLWSVLRRAVSRPNQRPGKRVVVGDSKDVYSSGKGLADLERTVHAKLRLAKPTVADFVNRLCPECHPALRQEAWYTGTTLLPIDAATDACDSAADMIAELCAELGIQIGPIRSEIVCPVAFNALLDKWGSKGAILASSLVRLLGGLPAEPEDVTIVIDKHGGRNNYSATLQPAFADDLVLAREEGSQRSVYQVTDRGRPVSITFEPRADANHFCVALASMVSKYLREILMLEFNQFWQSKLPGLKATAGYPTDSGRFWQEIRPVAEQMGLAADVLWRRK